MNFHLKPAPVAVLDCAAVADEFDARFSAIARHYRYRILTRRAAPRDRAKSRLVAQSCARRGGYGRGCADARRPARLHDVSRVSMSGEVACPHARPARGLSIRRRDPYRSFSAVVSSQPSTLDGRQPQAGRRGQVDASRHAGRARGERPDAMRNGRARLRTLPHRRRLSVSCGLAFALDLHLLRLAFGLRRLWDLDGEHAVLERRLDRFGIDVEGNRHRALEGAIGSLGAMEDAILARRSPRTFPTSFRPKW